MLLFLVSRWWLTSSYVLFKLSWTFPETERGSRFWITSLLIDSKYYRTLPNCVLTFCCDLLWPTLGNRRVSWLKNRFGCCLSKNTKKAAYTIKNWGCCYFFNRRWFFISSAIIVRYKTLGSFLQFRYICKHINQPLGATIQNLWKFLTTGLSNSSM